MKPSANSQAKSKTDASVADSTTVPNVLTDSGDFWQLPAKMRKLAKQLDSEVLQPTRSALERADKKREQDRDQVADDGTLKSFGGAIAALLPLGIALFGFYIMFSGLTRE